VTYTVIDGVIVHEDRDGVQRNYRPDTLGNTVALTDATTTTDTMAYWPYGEVRTRTGTNATRFLFVGTLGYSQDGGSGKLHYVRARYYMASWGRWTTVDPLWPFLSPYGYVRSHPLNSSDPSGLLTCEEKYQICLRNANTAFATCLAAAGTVGLACGGICSAGPTPPCLACIAIVVAAIAACGAAKLIMDRACDAAKANCLERCKPVPPPPPGLPPDPCFLKAIKECSKPGRGQGCFEKEYKKCIQGKGGPPPPRETPWPRWLTR
jgi:RHS repeat-associated protein